MPSNTNVLDELNAIASDVSRRKFVAGAAVGAASLKRGFAADLPYKVGAGVNSSPYLATNRAIDACGEWPALQVAGKVVIIKPNLVGRATAASGTVTDAEVVRAVVDRLLADGAIFIIIIESGASGANFDACGYGFFRTYDAQNRIRLVDLQSLPNTLNAFPGWAYTGIYAPTVILRRDYLFINIAKLKTHAESLVTLATKNLFGLPDITRYVSSPAGGRFAMHDRALSQAIVDLNLLRSTNFAIVDGIVGMEGLGPWQGSPVRMDTVLAGRNVVAVDRVAMACMNVAQHYVRHINYATLFKLGPAGLNEITVSGDTLTPRTFLLPAVPPSFDFPSMNRVSFSPAQGQTTSAATKYLTPCSRTVRVYRLSDLQPSMELIRTLAPEAYRAPQTEATVWDGRRDDGTIAQPGRYAVHVAVQDPGKTRRYAGGLAWTQVLP